MIFSFFFKKESKTKLLNIDLHSHLIPMIDDGSESMEESLSLLREMVTLGYKKIITTPHIMSDTYINTPDIINEGLEKLLEASKNEGINIEIEAGAEYYLDDGFYDVLQKGDMMSINDKYLLVETSYIGKPLQFEEMIYEIGLAGYKVILAHPERYRYIKNPKKEYERFKELGILFQVNINSFGGYYGKSAKNLADFLNKNGMIDFLGSDVHHEKHVSTLKNVMDSKVYKSIFKQNNILNDTL